MNTSYIAFKGWCMHIAHFNHQKKNLVILYNRRNKY